MKALYLRTTYAAPKIRAFIDFLKMRYGNPPYWEVPPATRQEEAIITFIAHQFKEDDHEFFSL